MSVVLGHFSQPGRRPHGNLDHQGNGTGRTDERPQFTESTGFPLPVSCVEMLTNDLKAYG